MVIYLNNIAKSYTNTKAIDNINLELSNGIYGLLGSNGAGKTTLFKIISGEIKKYEGKILLNDKPLNKSKVTIGYLPQNFKGYSNFKVKEFLEYMGILKLSCIDKKINVKKDINRKIEFFALDSILSKKMSNLSGGQLRKVGLAQAFLLDPQIILLDEPTAGLDPKERIRFKNYICSLQHNKIIIISTHIVADIENIVEKIFILKSGKIVMEGREEELKSQGRKFTWEARLNSKKELNSFYNLFNISEVLEEDGIIKVRIISGERPDLIDVINTKPSLDEIYLYNFNEEKSHDKI